LTVISADEANAGSLYEKLAIGAKLHFTEQIKKIKIVAKEDGPEEEIDFHIDAGHVEQLVSFVNRLAKVDWRWRQSGFEIRKKSRKLVDLATVFYTQYYDGHSMVALSEVMPKTAENPEGGFFEVARCECFAIKECICGWKFGAIGVGSEMWI
jgi:hypothetical protein